MHGGSWTPAQVAALLDRRPPERHDKAADAEGLIKLEQLHGQFDSVPSDNGQSNIAHKHDRTENAPT
jgi:hypothetical protein